MMIFLPLRLIRNIPTRRMLFSYTWNVSYFIPYRNPKYPYQGLICIYKLPESVDMRGTGATASSQDQWFKCR